MDTHRLSAIEKACAVLDRGGTILYPTDTIWGIGCDATTAPAVERVRRLKGRADAKALILLAADLDMIEPYVEPISDKVRALVETSPTPLTVIYRGAHGLAHGVASAEGTVAFRVPKSTLCIEMCRQLGRPIVSTSANFSDHPSPATFNDIEDGIKEGVDYIFPADCDDGCGCPSKIVLVNADGTLTTLRK